MFPEVLGHLAASRSVNVDQFFYFTVEMQSLNH